MKKLLAVVAAALAACMLFVFVGCGAEDVAGKTYTYDRCEVSGEGAELFEARMDETYDGATISFADGKMTMTIVGGSPSTIEYTQDGDTIKVESSTHELGTIKVSGGSIVMEMSDGGVTAKIYFES